MDVRCEKCDTTYELDDSRVTDAGVNVRCSNCGNLFRVRRRGPVTREMPRLRSGIATQPAGSSATPETARPLSSGGPLTSGAPFRDRLWYLRLRHSKEVLRFRDLTMLRRWILEKRVSREDDVSRGGSKWRRLGTIVELEAFFHQAEQTERTQLRSGRGGQVLAPAPSTGSAAVRGGLSPETGRHLLGVGVPLPMSALGSRGNRAAVRGIEDGAPSGALRLSGTGRTMRPRLDEAPGEEQALPVPGILAPRSPLTADAALRPRAAASPPPRPISAPPQSSRSPRPSLPGAAVPQPIHDRPSGAIPQPITARGPDHMHRHVLGQSVQGQLDTAGADLLTAPPRAASSATDTPRASKDEGASAPLTARLVADGPLPLAPATPPTPRVRPASSKPDLAPSPTPRASSLPGGSGPSAEEPAPTARLRSLPEPPPRASGSGNGSANGEDALRSSQRRRGQGTVEGAAPSPPSTVLQVLVGVTLAAAAAVLAYTAGRNAHLLPGLSTLGGAGTLGSARLSGGLAPTYLEGKRLLHNDVEEEFPQAEDQLLRAAGSSERDPLPHAALAELHATWSRYLAQDAQTAESDLALYLGSEAQRHLREARHQAEEALRRGGSSPEAHRAMAMVLVDSGAPESEVEAHLGRAVPPPTSGRGAPSLSDSELAMEALWVRALLQIRDQHHTQARALLEEALRASRLPSGAWRVRPALALGRLMQKANDLDGARQEFSEVTTLSPNHRRARSALAALGNANERG